MAFLVTVPWPIVSVAAPVRGQIVTGALVIEGYGQIFSGELFKFWGVQIL